MIDVAEAIDAESINVTHRSVAAAGGAYVDGEWIATSPATTTIRAAIQPATGRQLMDLPEGIRTEAKFFIWSRVSFVENDRITFGGETWRVIFLWPRPMDGFTRGALGKMS